MTRKPYTSEDVLKSGLVITGLLLKKAVILMVYIKS